MSDTNRTALEQGRAKAAYKFAEEGKQLGDRPKPNSKGKIQDSKQAKEYKAYCKKIPMMIKTNGLGATYAFINSKKKEAYDLIYNQTHAWLKQDDKLGIFSLEKYSGKDLVEIIIDQNSAEYRYLTIEVLALFNWLRRFAEGLIDGEENGGE
jgi:CRISPR-associated protein Cmr5